MESVAKIVARNFELLRQHEPDKPSQAAFARRCGLQQRTYNRIVLGEVEPSLSSIELVARKMHLHAWQLMVDDFHPDVPPQLAPVGNQQALHAHLRALRKLLPEDF